MNRINIIGAGHVGQTLGSLLRPNTFDIRGVLNRSIESGRRAVEVIGGGHAVASLTDLPDADVYLITTGDDAIEDTCARLTTEVNVEGSIVVHCSGSLPSSLLRSARDAGAAVASVHPIKSFADVSTSVTTFAGTFCGIEGDAEALAVLEPAFSAIGGNTFRIDPEQKTLYHAAIVFSMNYFITLVDIGLRCYEKAGVSHDLALQLLNPILTGAATNVTRLGPAKALTGPVARGDVTVVERQLNALAEWQPELRDLYAALGAQTIGVSAQAGNADDADLERLRNMFNQAG